MRQGADRAALSDRANDLYETPQCAIRTLIGVEVLPGRIWEPCAGRGAISRELIGAGKRVTSMDLVAHPGADPGIETPIDFLMELTPPPGVQAIVTNPPFKNADAFIRKGLGFGLSVTVLLRLMALEGAGRSDLIDNHLIRVWAGIERLPQMHREGWTGNRTSNSGAPFAWFVFDPIARGERPIEFRRVSWRAA